MKTFVCSYHFSIPYAERFIVEARSRAHALEQITSALRCGSFEVLHTQEHRNAHRKLVRVHRPATPDDTANFRLDGARLLWTPTYIERLNACLI
jgi:hypothetical protein